MFRERCEIIRFHCLIVCYFELFKLVFSCINVAGSSRGLYHVYSWPFGGKYFKLKGILGNDEGCPRFIMISDTLK